MSHRKTLSRLTIASLAAAALAAPAAVAQPIDMHASTVHKPKPAKVDLRGEASADSTAPESKSPIGLPTWPMYPKPLPAPKAAPAAVADDTDGGIDIPASVLIIAGTVALGGGMGVVALRTRPRTRTAR